MGKPYLYLKLFPKSPVLFLYIRKYIVQESEGDNLNALGTIQGVYIRNCALQIVAILPATLPLTELSVADTLVIKMFPTF